MKLRITILLAFAIAIIAAGTGKAEASTWTPGTPFYAEETWIDDYLERQYDFAYCQGIARFGKYGSFPDEKFHVFSCSTELNDTYCTNVRYKAVKLRRRNWYRLIMTRTGYCY